MIIATTVEEIGSIDRIVEYCLLFGLPPRTAAAIDHSKAMFEQLDADKSGDLSEQEFQSIFSEFFVCVRLDLNHCSVWIFMNPAGTAHLHDRGNVHQQREECCEVGSWHDGGSPGDVGAPSIRQSLPSRCKDSENMSLDAIRGMPAAESQDRT